MRNKKEKNKRARYDLTWCVGSPALIPGLPAHHHRRTRAKVPGLADARLSEGGIDAVSIFFFLVASDDGNDPCSGSQDLFGYLCQSPVILVGGGVRFRERGPDCSRSGKRIS